MKINRNMTAVNANTFLRRTENRLQKSMERLSSGVKITSAEDNPAGMAISNKMKAQINGLDKAKANSSDARNVMNIADGALGEITSVIQRMRELAVQAATGTNTDEERKTIQNEIEELKEEIDRISSDTEYNNKSLLDGSSDSRVYTRELDTNGNAVLSNSSISRYNISDEVEPGKYEFTIRQTGTPATADILMVADPVGFDGEINVNGSSMTVTGDMSKQEFLAGLKSLGDTAGFKVTEDVNTIGLEATSNLGGSGLDIRLSGEVTALATGWFTREEDGTASLSSPGSDATIELGEGFENCNYTIDGNRVYVTGNGGFTMDFLISDSIDMADGEKTFQIDVTDIGNMVIQVGANQYQEMALKIPEVSTSSMYLDGDNLDVSSVKGAKRALDRLDDALSFVNSARSRIGAFDNRLEYAENSLAESSQNITEAYSTLMDTDMATEMTEYASQNILNQAGISVLSQANDLPQQVLSLLTR